MTLLRQANEVADLLEQAVYELRQERADGDNVEFVNSRGVRTATLRGKTPEELKTAAMRACKFEIGEIIFDPEGGDYFATVDHNDLLPLLDDPLSARTRGSRRYLLAASALVFLMGATGEMPSKVPGFDFDLKNHPQHSLIVGGLAFAVLAYQGFSFALYARADIARRSIVQTQVGEHVRALKSCLARVSEELNTLETCEAPGKFSEFLDGWTAHAKTEMTRLERRWKTANDQRRWDVWLPLPLVAVAVIVFLARWAL